MGAAKKNSGSVSKKDFIEQLESFIAKDKKTESKNTDSEEVVIDKENADVEESEEDFDAELTLNLVDLNHLAEQQTEIKIEATLLGENIELPTEGIFVDSTKRVIPSEEVVEINPNSLENAKDLIFNLEELVSKNSSLTLDDDSNDTDQIQVEKILLELETRLNENPELEVKDIIKELLSETETELGNTFEKFDIQSIENISQIKLETLLAKNKQTLLENHEINEMPEEGIKEIVTEQVDLTTEAQNSEHLLENDFEAQAVELSTVEMFESVNRVDFTSESRPPIKSVAQEDFISNVEALMITETDTLDGSDKITTARIQLTPERLGKVDLQIEINGKELTAKLYVEQKETKEWIDQQVAHLKEKLLTQEITVKDFQVVVHEETLNDAFMSSDDNPFFKQKEKDSQRQKEQRLLKNQAVDIPVHPKERSYSTRNGISILV